MKIPPRQVDAFLKKPDANIRAVLIYGPDEGMMRERAAILGKTVVPDLSDPFNVAVLSAAILSDDPARLNDEANAMSLMGGARLIRVEGAGDGLAPLLKAYLANPSPANLVVLEAGDLGPKALRKLFETAPNAAAIPCYAAGVGDVQVLIRQDLQAEGYGIDADACAWLAQQLTGDRQMARNETTKLAVYMASAPKGARATLEDVQACCGQDGDRSLDDLIYAAGGGNPELALRAFRQLVDEGTAIISIQRALQNHFRRLHYVLGMMKGGQSMDQAMNALNPRVFFKWEDAFRNQLGRWSMDTLEGILTRLAQLEADCKKTGTPDEILTAQAILSLAARK